MLRWAITAIHIILDTFITYKKLLAKPYDVRNILIKNHILDKRYQRWATPIVFLSVVRWKNDNGIESVITLRINAFGDDRSDIAYALK